MLKAMNPGRPAREGEEFRSRDGRGQEWVLSWHPPELPAPAGRANGSAGICFTPENDIVVVTWPGVAWKFPAGRPEEDEGWRATLDREVMEEACAVVEDATLVGFARGACVEGSEKGLALVRSLCGAPTSRSTRGSLVTRPRPGWLCRPPKRWSEWDSAAITGPSTRGGSATL